MYDFSIVCVECVGVMVDDREMVEMSWHSASVAGNTPIGSPHGIALDESDSSDFKRDAI